MTKMTRRYEIWVWKKKRKKSFQQQSATTASILPAATKSIQQQLHKEPQLSSSATSTRMRKEIPHTVGNSLWRRRTDKFLARFYRLLQGHIPPFVSSGFIAARAALLFMVIAVIFKGEYIGILLSSSISVCHGPPVKFGSQNFIALSFWVLALCILLLLDVMVTLLARAPWGKLTGLFDRVCVWSACGSICWFVSSWVSDDKRIDYLMASFKLLSVHFRTCHSLSHSLSNHFIVVTLIVMPSSVLCLSSLRRLVLRA